MYTHIPKIKSISPSIVKKSGVGHLNIWPNFKVQGPQLVKKSLAFKNVWRTWGQAFPTLLVDLMIFCPQDPIGPTNFKNSANMQNIEKNEQTTK
jgi:hypothetical protein